MGQIIKFCVITYKRLTYNVFCPLQKQCCGAYNYTDYKTAGYSQDQTLSINPSVVVTGAQVPISCCQRPDGDVDVDTPTRLDAFNDLALAACLGGNSMYINKQVFIFTALTPHHKP